MILYKLSQTTQMPSSFQSTAAISSEMIYAAGSKFPVFTAEHSCASTQAMPCTLLAAFAVLEHGIRRKTLPLKLHKIPWLDSWPGVG